MKSILLGCILCLFSFPCFADLSFSLVADGFKRPVWAGAPDSTKGKLWIMEQEGKVWIIDLATGKRHAKPFLDISHLVTRRGNEQGLLGLAFSPDFAESGKYYVNYNAKGGDTCIVRFVSKDRKTTDKNSGEVLLRFAQPYRNHNGGWLDFGPDGFLYIATGDGGAANDPRNLAQNMKSFLGKLLRLDVSKSGSYRIPAQNPYIGKKSILPEIIASGLRNPWRCSFDAKTGDFWVADVGQNAWEEVNFLKAGTLEKKNFGWRFREGQVQTPKKKIAGKRPLNHVEPVYTYEHGRAPREGLSVTGGYVYRGSKIPALKGRYIFGDYQNPRVWSIKLEDGKVDFKDHTNAFKVIGRQLHLISSFAEDAEGELYLIDHRGAIYRFE